MSEAVMQLLFQPDVRNSRSIVFLVTKFTAASESKYTNYSLTQPMNCTKKVRTTKSRKKTSKFFHCQLSVHENNNSQNISQSLELRIFTTFIFYNFM